MNEKELEAKLTELDPHTLGEILRDLWVDQVRSDRISNMDAGDMVSEILEYVTDNHPAKRWESWVKEVWDLYVPDPEPESKMQKFICSFLFQDQEQEYTAESPGGAAELFAEDNFDDEEYDESPTSVDVTLKDEDGVEHEITVAIEATFTFKAGD
jgi:hypothetical protein